ncbi:LysR family transcriptional regulator [Mycobacterium riyadhense]|uniref:LysR family transcriptional regulator n=1 Tax=Mycobacterium riyadhense TaxID=486698 RepID=UPI00195D132B|nr:LysR family transcriptional regulator [Mycobacterium riyadhense]
MIDSDSDWFALLAPQLSIAVAVLEEQHITRAAHKLGVPQPTVTAAMRRIGEAIGAPLVQQSGRGIAITPAGRAFLPSARVALTSLRAARHEVSDIIDPDHGRVGLGFVHSRGVRDVPVLIDAFLAAYPDITFGLQQGPIDELLEQMLSGTIDVAVVAPIPDDPRLESVVLDDERLYLVVSTRHRLARRRSVRWHEVAGESFIALTEPYGLRQVFDRLCAQAGFEPALVFEGQEITTVRGLVRAGLGVALLPGCPDARQRHAEEGLAEIPISRPVAHREVGAIWIKNRHPSPAARRFIEFLTTSGVRVLAESRDGQCGAAQSTR